MRFAHRATARGSFGIDRSSGSVLLAQRTAMAFVRFDTSRPT
jgi:hypothetical protein